MCCPRIFHGLPNVHELCCKRVKYFSHISNQHTAQGQTNIEGMSSLVFLFTRTNAILTISALSELLTISQVVRELIEILESTQEVNSYKVCSIISTMYKELHIFATLLHILSQL